MTVSYTVGIIYKFSNMSIPDMDVETLINAQDLKTLLVANGIGFTITKLDTSDRTASVIPPIITDQTYQFLFDTMPNFSDIQSDDRDFANEFKAWLILYAYSFRLLVVITSDVTNTL